MCVWGRGRVPVPSRRGIRKDHKSQRSLQLRGQPRLSKAPSSRRSPDRPGWSRPAGQQLGGRSPPRPRGVDRIAGTLFLRVGRETRSSLPVPDPVATAHSGPRFGKWVARAPGSCRGPGALGRKRERRESRESPGRGSRASAGPGREGSVPAAASVAPSLAGPFRARASPDTASSSRGRVSAGPLRSPRQPPLRFQGQDGRPTSARINCFPPTLPRPERPVPAAEPQRPAVRVCLPPSKTAARGLVPAVAGAQGRGAAGATVGLKRPSRAARAAGFVNPGLRRGVLGRMDQPRASALTSNKKSPSLTPAYIQASAPRLSDRAHSPHYPRRGRARPRPPPP